jgi:hypothetical protein
MLNEFTQLTSYNRCYAAFLLRTHCKRLRVNKKIVLVGDITKRNKRVKMFNFKAQKVLNTTNNIYSKD